MPRIRAVLFDFGGTLFDYRTLMPAQYESLMDIVGWAGIDTDLDAVREAYAEAWQSTSAEYLSIPYYLHRDFFRDIVARILVKLGGALRNGLFDRYSAALRERHRRDFELREGVVETLESLRDAGLYLGIVSNIDEDQLDYFMDISQLRPLLDSCLSSEAAGSCKPDRAIFDMAIDMAGCRAEEALFVGDSAAADIAGANHAGLPSVLIWDRDDRNPPETDPHPVHCIRRIPELLNVV